mmetsp:Transcript_33335/g.70066  ORF Transcript_33335/g.70066 Transcript_33335/m.70066 type:complete len:465 (+) Transcript_33335:176-1570(+)
MRLGTPQIPPRHVPGRRRQDQTGPHRPRHVQPAPLPLQKRPSHERAIRHALRRQGTVSPPSHRANGDQEGEGRVEDHLPGVSQVHRGRLGRGQRGQQQGLQSRLESQIAFEEQQQERRRGHALGLVQILQAERDLPHQARQILRRQIRQERMLHETPHGPNRQEEAVGRMEGVPSVSQVSRSGVRRHGGQREPVQSQFQEEHDELSFQGQREEFEVQEEREERQCEQEGWEEDGSVRGPAVRRGGVLPCASQCQVGQEEGIGRLEGPPRHLPRLRPRRLLQRRQHPQSLLPRHRPRLRRLRQRDLLPQIRQVPRVVQRLLLQSQEEDTRQGHEVPRRARQGRTVLGRRRRGSQSSRAGEDEVQGRERVQRRLERGESGARQDEEEGRQVQVQVESIQGRQRRRKRWRQERQGKRRREGFQIGLGARRRRRQRRRREQIQQQQQQRRQWRKLRGRHRLRRQQNRV